MAEGRKVSLWSVHASLQMCSHDRINGKSGSLCERKGRSFAGWTGPVCSFLRRGCGWKF